MLPPKISRMCGWPPPCQINPVMVLKYTCTYNTSKEKMQKEEKGSLFPTPHPKQTLKCTHESHKHNTHERAGHQMPSLENWDSGLKIFHGANSPHVHVHVCRTALLLQLQHLCK